MRVSSGASPSTAASPVIQPQTGSAAERPAEAGSGSTPIPGVTAVQAASREPSDQARASLVSSAPSNEIEQFAQAIESKWRTSASARIYTFGRDARPKGQLINASA